LPHRPKFKRDEIQVAGEVFEMYHRDITECIKALYGDPQFADHMHFAPEQHFTSNEENVMRLYHDMYTGEWWWKTQVRF
jgi:hypothetical protein